MLLRNLAIRAAGGTMLTALIWIAVFMHSGDINKATIFVACVLGACIATIVAAVGGLALCGLFDK